MLKLSWYEKFLKTFLLWGCPPISSILVVLEDMLHSAYLLRRSQLPINSSSKTIGAYVTLKSVRRHSLASSFHSHNKRTPKENTILAYSFAMQECSAHLWTWSELFETFQFPFLTLLPAPLAIASFQEEKHCGADFLFYNPGRTNYVFLHSLSVMSPGFTCAELMINSFTTLYFSSAVQTQHRSSLWGNARQQYVLGE